MGYQERVEAQAATRTGTPAEKMAAAKQAGDFPAFLAAQRAEAEAQAAQAQTEYDASLQGQLAHVQSEQRIVGALMTQEEWDAMHDLNGWPHEPKPDAFKNLTIEERAAVAQERMAAVFRKRTQG